MKTARRQAREAALQALYAWQLSGGDPLDQMRSLEQTGRDAGRDAGRADLAFAESILRGVHERAVELQALITPHLDRKFERLSPVERAILYIGSFELAAHPDTPFKVVLNEAIELGKSFGGAEGHRFVNGVLEKVAGAVRSEEVARARKIA
jgi:N utilization substance protein B